MQKYPTKMLIISAILLCYPALLFAMKGGMNGLFFLLVGLSLFTLFRGGQVHPKHFDNNAIALAIALSSAALAIFLSQAYHGHFDPHPYDGASRFLLAIPVYLVLRSINLRTLMSFQYGLPLGAMTALLLVLFTSGHYFNTARASTAFMHPIYFGDLSLMLGFLSLFSINLFKRDAPLLISLKTLGCVAGIYVSILSESRGGWIAIPILLTMWLVIQNKKQRYIRLAYAFPLLVVTLLASYFFISIIQHRIDRIFYELANFSNGQADSSIGIRLQLWKAALHLYGNNPLFGVGPDGFAQSMASLSQSGFITPEAAKLGRGEVHSQILASLVGLGIPGLLSILAIYFVPLFMFWKATHSSVNAQRNAGTMGVCLTLGFFLFGLSVETFNIKMIVSFYSLTLAVLLAIAHHKDDAVS